MASIAAASNEGKGKHRLNIFLPMSHAEGPNIAARDIVEEAMTLLNAHQESGDEPA
jgi:hypothetical protein